jgi:hypothetical protein
MQLRVGRAIVSESATPRAPTSLSTEVSGRDGSTTPAVATQSRRRGIFFSAISLAMLGAMLIGFSRTYYLRSFFGTEDMLGAAELPRHLHLHGAIMSAWFGLVFVQTWLIRGNRVAIHRRVGVLGALLAVAVVVVGIHTVASFVPRANLVEVEGPVSVTNVVAGDMLVMILFFPALVGAGIWFRSEPEMHKRLVLLSCMTLWLPVLSRYAATFATLEWPIWPVLALTPFTWLIALVAYDFVKRGRPHAATVWGGLTVVLTIFAGGPLANTDGVRRFVEWLG